MKLLFIHQGFPGQYIHILRALDKQGGHQLVGLGLQKADRPLPQSVQYFRYALSRGNQPGIHPFLHDLESKVIRGEACARAAEQMKQQGFTPDLICGHAGWGELLFLKDVWPSVPTLTYQEFFYNPRGFDVDFDPEFQEEANPNDWAKAARIRMKTANPLLNLESSNWSVTPTHFQRNSFPESHRNRISVIHDGIDTNIACPNSKPDPLELHDGTVLTAGDQVITFVNRTLEPYRGCHTLIRAIPELQRLAPEARLLIIGKTEGVSYGKACSKGTWKDRFLAEIDGQYDPSRVHFAGQVSYEQFLRVLQLSRVHVYLTYPFVLSWSLLEAMSCSCAVVGSDTAPVKEVIEHQKNGLLVDFFDSKQLAAAVDVLLKDREMARRLGENARKTILERFELQNCVQRQLSLIHHLAQPEVDDQHSGLFSQP